MNEPHDDTDLDAAPVPPSPADASLRDLAAAVLAGGEVEELLDLLVAAALPRSRARTVALALPIEQGRWVLEVAHGQDAEDLLGLALPGDSPLHEAVGSRDAGRVAALTELRTQEGEHRLAAEIVDAREQGTGALLALREPDGEPFGEAEHAALEAIALLAAVALTGPVADGERELDDERRRIARDLHDLAIQELFAVGMELEGLTEALGSSPGAISNTSIRRTVETSLQGVENAVAQIRQIVQSLRRERTEATLSERLRHETGLATAGLGYAPALRLPKDPAAMDAEVPEEIAEDVVAVVREALANAARHAHATAVAVAVTLFSEGVDRVVQVAVSDNGRGIDPSVTRRSGLANMSSRARRHQGWVDAINLEPGTMISWRVTLPQT